MESRGFCPARRVPVNKLSGCDLVEREEEMDGWSWGMLPCPDVPESKPVQDNGRMDVVANECPRRATTASTAGLWLNWWEGAGGVCRKLRGSTHLDLSLSREHLAALCVSRSHAEAAWRRKVVKKVANLADQRHAHGCMSPLLPRNQVERCLKKALGF